MPRVWHVSNTVESHPEHVKRRLGLEIRNQVMASALREAFEVSDGDGER